MKIFTVLMTLLLLVALIASCASPAAKEAPVDPLSGEKLFADVAKYVSFGIHRTAYPGDIETAKWIAESLEQAGLDVELKTWPVRQFFLKECSLVVDGEEFDSFPGWYPNTEPVTGTLAQYSRKDHSNLKGNIAYAGSEVGMAVQTRLFKIAEAVRDEGAIALVIVGQTQGDSGLISAGNARQKGDGLEYHQSPLPIPTIVVAPNDNAKLAAAAARGATVSINIEGEDKADAKAHNVVGILDRGDKWIVVTTPMSGWFTCGGERGPGIAMFLGMARLFAQQDTEHSLAFISVSGHELWFSGGHYILDEYLPAYNINPENVTIWCHLGACISCRTWERVGNDYIPLDERTTSYLVGTEEVFPLLETAFKDIDNLNIGTGAYGGEMRSIADAGFNAFHFFGINYFFHTAQDTEKETSPELLEPIARAIANILVQLDSK